MFPYYAAQPNPERLLECRSSDQSVADDAPDLLPTRSKNPAPATLTACHPSHSLRSQRGLDCEGYGSAAADAIGRTPDAGR